MKSKSVSRSELEKMREEMSSREIAQKLGISIPTVYKLFREAGIEIGNKIKLVD
jgi:hypothetical protein